MSKIKVLFKMQYLYHKAAYDPLIDVFEADDRFDVYLSLSHELVRRLWIFEIDKTKPYLEQWKREGHQISDEDEHFDIVICPDTVEEKKFGKTMLCLVHHGMGLKTILFRNLKNHNMHHYDILVEGQYRVEALEQSGVLNGSHVYKVGLPKLDPLFWEEHFDREKILTDLGLDPEKKTVLYAPTYKPTSVYDLKDAIFEATTDYNLIIKLHHYAWMGKFAHHSQHRTIQWRLRKYDHATLIPKDEYNIIPLMYATDTLVAAASSTVYNFLATGKTGVIYDLDHDNMRHSDGQHILNIDNREFLKDAFVHIFSPEELQDGIRKALNPTPAMQKNAAERREYYYYKPDGKSSIRTRDKILELYEEGRHLNDPTNV
ncbi:MAG: CDP-glycerol glycerophosphotransferase family protein [Candidatus Marinimicrobia bacterium]|nr:CDP-glycerol glycerophosphotransferase family protein [Candidatus Neomarinimicrobiota bacterium]MCF7829240.1 CDP-glycerol glycerophosphotransferase family protein [Candidatus Neomarinimicrobiota bacterium]MCF7881107.1 CDP-glycerol glycerophosphotransferase family protein [Candidatus Neomarinimicrobiota bacterium]